MSTAYSGSTAINAKNAIASARGTSICAASAAQDSRERGAEDRGARAHAVEQRIAASVQQLDDEPLQPEPETP